MITRVPCKMCGGTGMHDLAESCGYCKGTGDAPNYFDNPLNRQAFDRYINDCGPEREDA